MPAKIGDQPPVQNTNSLNLDPDEKGDSDSFQLDSGGRRRADIRSFKQESIGWVRQMPEFGNQLDRSFEGSQLEKGIAKSGNIYSASLQAAKEGREQSLAAAQQEMLGFSISKSSKAIPYFPTAQFHFEGRKLVQETVHCLPMSSDFGGIPNSFRVGESHSDEKRSCSSTQNPPFLRYECGSVGENTLFCAVLKCQKIAEGASLCRPFVPKPEDTGHYYRTPPVPSKEATEGNKAPPPPYLDVRCESVNNLTSCKIARCDPVSDKITFCEKFSPKLEDIGRNYIKEIDPLTKAQQCIDELERDEQAEKKGSI